MSHAHESAQAHLLASSIALQATADMRSDLSDPVAASAEEAAYMRAGVRTAIHFLRVLEASGIQVDLAQLVNGAAIVAEEVAMEIERETARLVAANAEDMK